MRQKLTLSQKFYEKASQVANDAVGSIRTVASFCAEDRVMQLYEERCQGPVKAGIKHGLIASAGIGLSYFLLFAVYACAFYSGARLVQDGKMTFSDVFRVSFLLFFIFFVYCAYLSTPSSWDGIFIFFFLPYM